MENLILENIGLSFTIICLLLLITIILYIEKKEELSFIEKNLDKLADSEDWEIRRAVAKNENTSKKTLDKLAADRMAYVRIAVAENIEHRKS